MQFNTGARSATSADLKHGAVARRLAQLSTFSEIETRLIRETCSGAAASFPPRSVITLQRESADSLKFVASGWAAWVSELRDGRRQLVQLLLPGDMISRMTTKPRVQFLQALTSVQIIDGSAIAQAAGNRERHPGIAAALESVSIQERALLMAHVVRLGRQTAVERVAHLLLELHSRLGAIGMAEHNEIPFPMTQEVVADLLGLSVVHVNRTLMSLKRSDAISIAHGRVQLLDMPTLEKLSEFRPTN